MILLLPFFSRLTFFGTGSSSSMSMILRLDLAFAGEAGSGLTDGRREEEAAGWVGAGECCGCAAGRGLMSLSSSHSSAVSLSALEGRAGLTHRPSCI
jgi:hypothetical protein